MTAIDDIIEDILEVEGARYTEHPLDSGGPTKYGITLDAYSQFIHGPARAEELAALTADEARSFYRWRHVIEPGFVPVINESEAVAAELIDSSVHVGVFRAVEWLQRSLNALNRSGRDYPDVKVDGKCGHATVSALAAYLAKRGDDGEDVLLRALNCLQGAFYVALVERRSKDEAFLYGWLRTRVG